MKKFLIGLIILCSCVATIGILATAESLKEITAHLSHYPITVNGVPMLEGYSQVLVNDRVYLPIRYLCDILNIEIEWNEEERNITIVTPNGGDFTKDYQIEKETALKLADIYFESEFGKQFIQDTSAELEEETRDYYLIYRFSKKTVVSPITGKVEEHYAAGGGGGVYIGKKDGRILKVIVGE